MQFNQLPLVLEKIILDYKIGLETYLKQKKIMEKCCKKIHTISYKYKYDIERECYETLVIKFGKETYYYLHDELFLEVETSFCNSNTFEKYYLFENDKLTQYDKHE